MTNQKDVAATPLQRIGYQARLDTAIEVMK